jgi:GNAT superfamily N-acetyltransferase
MSEITIKPISSDSEKNVFIKFPWKIYHGDPNWVPPLLLDQKKLLDTKNNPFYKHAEIQLFLAYRDGQPAGRIAAILNNAHNNYWKEKVGFYGFFECINQPGVANQLFDTAKAWLKQKGMPVMRGPMNPSIYDSAGLLINAFDRPPVILMPYNPSYYVDLHERYGFKKIRDLNAYVSPTDVQPPEKLVKVAEMISRRTDVVIRNINMKKFIDEAMSIRNIFNDAWGDNWGHVPPTEEEFRYAAADLKQAVKPDFAFIAEYKGKPIGFSLTIPDLNQAIKHANGRLLPLGIFKLLYYMRKVDGLRVVLMGVNKAFRRRGVDAVFYLENMKRAKAQGYKWGEMSWVLDNNIMMNRTAEMLGAKLYKTYRVYELPIK